ncbi:MULTISPECIES: class I SAM-dependent RNA methyltransferase [Bradyrhizobium]|uniref:23S rRNA m(5)U-1939 methyltransferase n=2 Tax=Bradyrhizobium TaxID=374 RepID=A0ABY0PBZ9_9BRAD|nr:MULTISPECIES: methyltransferase [Bradyrhizobium]SDI05060.1 23S rRNA m(5)U-1939 methyltransferase [Bradyrhizobium ottawaense]SED85807.1 23S rRNA m(5)U-1939 methyltransferase [Bradyrhizobium lablabi]SHL81809.1 23S rRNA m(5)U-1939 methyltransferase [Bradyrhizobium lablabi]
MADIERLVIDHVGHRGDGVATVGGESVYVPYTLGGETVEVAPVPGHHPDRRRLVAVEIPSPERVAPFCPHFGICGGCAIQHWETAPYRAWKRDIVVTTLAQAGIACEVAPLIDAHGAGRRRITLHARMGTHEVLKVGFAAVSSHDIVPINRCPILDPHLDGAIEAAWAIAEPLIGVGKPLDIQVTATENGLDVDVRGSGPVSTKLIGKLSEVAKQHGLARLTRHGELVLARTTPVISIGAAQVALPPGSFLQATIAGEETLAALVADHCKRAKHVADLFCGVGPFALRLAAKSRVAAFDNDASSIAALQKAATSTSGLKPLKAEARDLFRRPLVPQELRDYDTVVFDPPRQGAQAVATHLAASKVPTVVAVSCNVATFARDARILIDGGYKIDGVTPVDQFRHTPHVELVARFRR